MTATQAWDWTKPLGEVMRALQVTADGLTESEARRRLAQWGLNDGGGERRASLIVAIAGRFANPLVLVLLFASILSAIAGEVASTVIIWVIVALSVTLDLVQQRRAEHAVDELRRSVALRASVCRGGAFEERPIEELVPGDVVRIAAGDIVPADCRLMASRDLFVNQALLTGESFPVEKHAGVAPPQDGEGVLPLDALYMGTSVIIGTGTALVCRTGRRTELGGLAGSLASRRPPDAFQIGIRKFGVLMVRFTVFLVLFVLAANALFHRDWLETMLFALALAVGLTPELLPAVVTVTLANGARRLAAKRVIAKRLAAIHDLGAMDVLCTDKTGTLTQSRIVLTGHVDTEGNDSDEVFRLAYVNSAFESGIRSPLDEAVLAHQGMDISPWRKIDEIPFDFERRRVSVLVERAGRRLLVVKGAPEDIIALSGAVARFGDGDVDMLLDDAGRKRLLAQFEGISARGERALGVAYREVAADHEQASIDDEKGLVFAGFVVFLDPPKETAVAAVQALAKAGIDLKILTGDNELVTRAVAEKIGIPVKGVITGREMQDLSQDALAAVLARTTIFARVTPAQKERVLVALKKQGRVAGYLGDGINDASALHAADVGISVDSAADVAKEAADLVLLEQDLGVVHEGVMEGRRTVENISKYILMGSSSNLGNMLSMAGAALMLPFLPMLPPQVLLNNLLYDISEVGVPFDTVDPESLAKPVHWDLDRIARFMLVLGPVSTIFDFLTFAVLLYVFHASEATFQTGWFMESLATQSLVVFVIRTRGRPWANLPHPLLAWLSAGVAVAGVVLPLTPLGPMMGFVMPPLGFFVFIVVAVVAYLVLVEIVKQAFQRRWLAT